MRNFRFWLPVVLYAAVIFTISSIESIDVPATIPHMDKIFHFCEYLPFGLFIARAFHRTLPKLSPKRLLVYVVISVFLYGLSDEFHQMFVEGRSASLADAIVDTIGGFVGGYMYSLFIRTIIKRR